MADRSYNFDEEDQMVYVLWRAGFTLRAIGAAFEMHPQEVKNLAIKVQKAVKRMNSTPRRPTVKSGAK